MSRLIYVWLQPAATALELNRVYFGRELDSSAIHQNEKARKAANVWNPPYASSSAVQHSIKVTIWETILSAIQTMMTTLWDGDQIKQSSGFAKVACIIFKCKNVSPCARTCPGCDKWRCCILVEIRIQSLLQPKYLFNNYKCFHRLSEP